MLLMELLETYPEASLLKEKFPKLYDYAYFVKVLDWQEEYAVADKNPEVIDEIEFWQMLLESGLISKEEYEKKAVFSTQICVKERGNSLQGYK